MKCFWALLPMLLLAACSTSTTHGSGAPQQPPEQQAPHLKPDEIHDDLIRQMLDKGQYYAALAHIEDAKRSGSNDELTLLEGDARGHLEQRAQAEALYRKLLDTRYAAQAYHGLGRLYVKTDLEGAIGNLRKAVERAPTDVDFRNDLGYALMETGRYTEAALQLSTAAELAPSERKSRHNLIILAMVMGNEGAVQQLVQQESGGMKPEQMSPEQLKDLREQLKDWRDSAQLIRDRQQKARAAKPAG